VGTGVEGVGGVFTGKLASINLAPGDQIFPVVGLGNKGDLYTSSDGFLWQCRGTPEGETIPLWKRLLREEDSLPGSSRGSDVPGVTGENLSNDVNSVGVWGRNLGIPTGGALVYGLGTGVLGQGKGIGVKGQSLTGDFGSQTLGPGIGVVGESNSVGVKGDGHAGRGGVFLGDAAQIHLVPSTADSPPPLGARGDLFLDSSGTLWLCTQGASRSADGVVDATWGKVTLTF
jgi:hypothetical protein